MSLIRVGSRPQYSVCQKVMISLCERDPDHPNPRPCGVQVRVPGPRKLPSQVRYTSLFDKLGASSSYSVQSCRRKVMHHEETYVAKNFAGVKGEFYASCG